MNIEAQKLTRITLIDERDQLYERFNVTIEIQVQDEGRTLKVFIRER